MKLKLQHKKFADEWIITANNVQSALKAGYSENYANSSSHLILNREDVQAYIKKRMEEIDAEKIADQKEIMEYLSAVMRGEIGDQVVVDSEDSQSNMLEVRPDTRDRLRATELLMKRYGMLTEKIDLSSESRVVIVDDID